MAQPDNFNGAPQPHAPNNTGVSVLITATLVLAANNDRKGAVIVNAGANPVYLALGTHAVPASGTGIYLAASGGTFKIDANFLWQGAIGGIAVGGTSIVTIAEV